MEENELIALRQSLEMLSREELLEMVWRLIETNSSVQQAVLKVVEVPQQVLVQQQHNPQLIKVLQEEIDSFVGAIQR
jgi:predicted XRE-type DNA-binding protein